MNVELPPRAQRSLLKLAALMGEQVLYVPLEVVDVNPGDAPAYTDLSGIYVSRRIIEREPQNLGVYVAHEIMHHVIDDALASSLYDHDTVNIAADYLINYILKQVFGMDVRRVGIPGVYSTKYRNKTLMEACAYYVKKEGENEALRGCGCKVGLTHPIIYSTAIAVRRLLAEHSMFSHLRFGEVREIVKLTSEEEQATFQELRDKFWRARFSSGTSINFDLLVRAIYGRLYAGTVRYDIRKDMPRLSHEHSVALAIRTDKLRSMTRNDPASSLLFATNLVKTLSSWGSPSWRQNLIDKQLSRIDKLENKIENRQFYSKRERLGFRKSIKRSRQKIEKLKNEKPLVHFLTDENRVEVRPTRDKSTGSAMIEAITIKEDHLPRMKKADIMEFARRVSRTEFKKLREIYEAKGKLAEYIRNTPKSKVSSVLEKEGPKSEHAHDHPERQDVPKIDPKPVIIVKTKREIKDEKKAERLRAKAEKERLKAEKKAAKEKAKTPKGKEGDAEYELPDDSENEEDQDSIQDDDSDDNEDSDGAPETKSGKDKKRKRNRDDEQDEEEPDADDLEITKDEDEAEFQVSDSKSDQATLQKGDSEQAQASAGGESDGSGESAASLELKTLELVSLNDKLLKKILIEADVFAEKLAHVSKSRMDPNVHLDRTYMFGDDVQRADTSSLVKLANDHTKLAFYADLANHALLQNSGTMPRRGSAIIALDCSGSMSGDRYVIAAGFALAMFRVMSDTKRGCALIKFASNVDGMYVCDERVPVDMMTLIQSLVSPSWGGTNFDSAFEQAILIQETFDWKNTQMILVTDGEGVVSPSVLRSASEKMRITGVIVGWYAKTIKGLSDVKHIRSPEELRQGLIHTAKTIL